MPVEPHALLTTLWALWVWIWHSCFSARISWQNVSNLSRFSRVWVQGLAHKLPILKYPQKHSVEETTIMGPIECEKILNIQFVFGWADICEYRELSFYCSKHVSSQKKSSLFSFSVRMNALSKVDHSLPWLSRIGSSILQVLKLSFVQKCINAVSHMSGELNVTRVYQGTGCIVRTIYDLSGGNFYGALLKDKGTLGAAKSNTNMLSSLMRRGDIASRCGWFHM